MWLQVNGTINPEIDSVEDVTGMIYRADKIPNNPLRGALPRVFFLKFTGVRHKELDSEAQVMGRPSWIKRPGRVRGANTTWQI